MFDFCKLPVLPGITFDVATIEGIGVFVERRAVPFHIARTRTEEFGRGIPYILVIHRAIVEDAGQLRLAQLGRHVTQSPIFVVMLCKICILVERDWNGYRQEHTREYRKRRPIPLCNPQI